jgi:hypothetical protein
VGQGPGEQSGGWSVQDPELRQLGERTGDLALDAIAVCLPVCMHSPGQGFPVDIELWESLWERVREARTR